MLSRKYLGIILILFLAACQSKGDYLDLSSAANNPNTTGTIYFALSGDSIDCRKPGLVFGRREGGLFRRVKLGRKAWQAKDNIVRLQAPAGTYALLSVSCRQYNTIYTVGFDRAGQSTGLYRSGLALFSIEPGTKINGGAVRAIFPRSSSFSNTRIGLVFITPMPADLKARLVKAFPETAEGIKEQLMQRETRSEAEQAYQKCISEEILSPNKSSNDLITRLERCRDMNPQRAVNQR